MNQPPYHPYDPPAAAPPEKPRGRRRLWLIGCGALLGAALLAVGTCTLFVVGGMAAGEKELGPVCERYLNEVFAGDYHAAYTEADPALHASDTEEHFVSLERAIHERTGALRSKKVGSVSEGADGNGRWGRLVYTAEFDSGPGTIRFDLRKRSDAWKIVSVRYNSPQLEQSIRSLLESAPSVADASTSQ